MSAEVADHRHSRRDCQATADVGVALSDMLNEHGFSVFDPEWEACRLLKVMDARNALSEILVRGGRVTWEYRSFSGNGPGLAQITDMMMDVLGADGDKYPDTAARRWPGRTLKETVGRVLRERGMQVSAVRLRGYDDDLADKYTEIVVRNPAKRHRGRAHIGDGGMIRWECCLSDPGTGARGVSPDEFAATVARALTHAEAMQEYPPTAFPQAR